ncbi:MAG: MFS transporter, partial [Actinomycetota bacterium]|nr:MFS transporter [Actinomycetota bacterium]
MRTWARGRLGALEERPFRLLWLARSASAVGDRMVPVALAFAVIELTGSGTDLGLVLASGLVPNVIFVLAGGVAGDRFDRSRVMLASDAVRAISQGAIAVLLLTGHASVWNLVVSSAVWGTAAAFFTPASTGIVPATVTPARLQQANALMALTRNVIGLGAPALSGILVAAVGTGVVFAIDSASFLVSAAFLLRLDLPKRALERGERFFDELRGGWRELTARTWLWVSVVGFGFWNVGLAVFFVLGPLVTARELGGARDWGLVMSGSAVGALTGGAVALRYRPTRPLVTVWVVTLTSSFQLLLLVPPAPAVVMALAAVVAMIGVSISIAVWTTTLQEHVPDRALSRVSAYDWLGSLVAMPLGYALAGPAAETIGVDTTLV